MITTSLMTVTSFHTNEFDDIELKDDYKLCDDNELYDDNEVSGNDEFYDQDKKVDGTWLQL